MPSGHRHAHLSVSPWYFYLRLHLPPLFSQKQQKPSEKKTAKVTLKDLRRANHSTSQPRNWNLTPDHPAGSTPANGSGASGGLARETRGSPPAAQPLLWFYLKETQRNTLQTVPTKHCPACHLSVKWPGKLLLHFSSVSRLRALSGSVQALKSSACKVLIRGPSQVISGTVTQCL